MTVLKKAGIAAAVATAGLLAFSPLAFAGTAPGHEGPDGHSSQGGHDSHAAPAGDCNIVQSTGDAAQSALLGLLDLNDVVSDANVAVPICDNNVNVQVIPIGSPNTQNND